MKIFLMAQGKGMRWEGDYCKQLAPIAGEPIIHRTVRQLVTIGHDVTVVGWEEFSDFAPVLFTQPEPIGTLLDGIRNTVHLWEDGPMGILLGDVVFSWNCLTMIGELRNQVNFFGRTKGNPYSGSPHAELYGFTCWKKHIPALKENLVWLLERPGRQNLWALYRRTIGVDYRAHRTERKVLREPGDYTDDIDSLEEYERAKLILDRLVRQDMEPGKVKKSNG